MIPPTTAPPTSADESESPASASTATLLWLSSSASPSFLTCLDETDSRVRSIQSKINGRDVAEQFGYSSHLLHQWLTRGHKGIQKQRQAATKGGQVGCLPSPTVRSWAGGCVGSVPGLGVVGLEGVGVLVGAAVGCPRNRDGELSQITGNRTPCVNGDVTCSCSLNKKAVRATQEEQIPEPGKIDERLTNFAGPVRKRSAGPNPPKKVP